MNNELITDDEHLLREIRNCIQAAENYRAKEGPLSPEAFGALDRANRAAEKLCERLWRLRGELDAIVAPATTELNSAGLRPHLEIGRASYRERVYVLV